mmetsp:Transcript_25229/g.79516  ORF Transcript_25229/g.79516 Transcript_25229/m.79516 type:complete len:445 (-) Transcript_25229:270-1604(-)
MQARSKYHRGKQTWHPCIVVRPESARHHPRNTPLASGGGRGPTRLWEFRSGMKSATTCQNDTGLLGGCGDCPLNVRQVQRRRHCERSRPWRSSRCPSRPRLSRSHGSPTRHPGSDWAVGRPLKSVAARLSGTRAPAPQRAIPSGGGGGGRTGKSPAVPRAPGRARGLAPSSGRRHTPGPGTPQGARLEADDADAPQHVLQAPHRGLQRHALGLRGPEGSGRGVQSLPPRNLGRLAAALWSTWQPCPEQRLKVRLEVMLVGREAVPPHPLGQGRDLGEALTAVCLHAARVDHSAPGHAAGPHLAEEPPRSRGIPGPGAGAQGCAKVRGARRGTAGLGGEACKALEGPADVARLSAGGNGCQVGLGQQVLREPVRAGLVPGLFGGFVLPKLGMQPHEEDKHAGGRPATRRAQLLEERQALFGPAAPERSEERLLRQPWSLGHGGVE